MGPRFWLRLGWRNVRRNRRRTAIEAIAIGGAVVLGTYFDNFSIGIYDQMIETTVRVGSGHIGVYHRDYLNERRREQLLDLPRVRARLTDLPATVQRWPRLYLGGLVRSSRGARSAVAVGLLFARERDGNPVLAAKRLAAGRLPERPNEVLMGATLAERLHLRPGNKFVWTAQDAEGELRSELLRVAGTVRTGVDEIDAGMLYVARSWLAERFFGGADVAHELALILPHRDAIAATLPLVRARLRDLPEVAAYPWDEAMPELADAIHLDRGGFLMFVFILYVLVAVGTINTLLMSVMERVREFGVLRALGLDRAGVRKLLFAEAFVLGLVGVGGGLLVAAVVTWASQVHGVDLSGVYGDLSYGGGIIDPVVRPAWHLRGMVAFAAAMLALALAASWYPSRWLLRKRPADAIRHY